MFGISKNVKYIAVAPGASKLPALKKVRPCRGLNPGCPCSLVNIENEEEFGVYSEQKSDLLLEKNFICWLPGSMLHKGLESKMNRNHFR